MRISTVKIACNYAIKQWNEEERPNVRERYYVFVNSHGQPSLMESSGYYVGGLPDFWTVA